MKLTSNLLASPGIPLILVPALIVVGFVLLAAGEFTGVLDNVTEIAQAVSNGWGSIKATFGL